MSTPDLSPDLSQDRLHGCADDIYAALIAAHEGLTPDESVALNARLILLLANLADNPEAVLAAIRQATVGTDGGSFGSGGV